jgi:hypothetical protein
MNENTAAPLKSLSEPLLKALHLLTRDGKLNSDSGRKLKQVHHLTQLIAPTLQHTLESRGKLHIADFGAGKSYLGFILYDLLLKSIPNSELSAIESRHELIEKSEKLAKDSGFDRMRFVSGTIASATLPSPLDFVCALHACDTATDDAIRFGLKENVHAFALVPCCQAEVARSLATLKVDHDSTAELHALFDHPIHRREFGSHLTNVIRSLFLSSQGYRVKVTELVGWEHSMKNELILAEKISDENHVASQKAKAQLEALLRRFPIKMKLLET